MSDFKDCFKFNPHNTLKIGMERECYLLNENNEISPLAPQVLAHLWSMVNGRHGCYGYELSACQLEERLVRPSDLKEVKTSLLINKEELQQAEKALCFNRVFLPTAPLNVPLNVYPDERYLKITKTMPTEQLKAACRVAGVHILVGMPNHEIALKVYNGVINHFDELCRIGSTPSNKRLEIYRSVVKSERMQLFEDHLMSSFNPPRYDNWQEFEARAKKEKFDKDPRRLWDFIRISCHGAIEFRMFDTTESIDQMCEWAVFCHSLCKTAM